MTTTVADVKSALTDGLTALHLPTMRRFYEEAATFSAAGNTQLRAIPASLGHT